MSITTERKQAVITEYGAKEGELPDNDALEQIVNLAERSSLDGVTWGLVYSDFLRTVAPFLSRVRFFRRYWWRLPRFFSPGRPGSKPGNYSRPRSGG